MLTPIMLSDNQRVQIIGDLLSDEDNLNVQMQTLKQKHSEVLRARDEIERNLLRLEGSMMEAYAIAQRFGINLPEERQKRTATSIAELAGKPNGEA